ncbi:MAG: hypothetical protein WA021_00870, partial [Minisyncoccia bacterium]
MESETPVGGEALERSITNILREYPSGVEFKLLNMRINGGKSDPGRVKSLLFQMKGAGFVELK